MIFKHKNLKGLNFSFFSFLCNSIARLQYLIYPCRQCTVWLVLIIGVNGAGDAGDISPPIFEVPGI